MLRTVAVKEQVWLTSALTDADVPDVLTLGFSLRKVITCHKSAVLVSLKVSRELRESFDYCFDFVFTLDEKRNTGGLEMEDFAKLFALTLHCFEKCVMLSPKMLVVKNCDELFHQMEKSSQALVWTENGGNSSIFLVRPSLLVFKELMKGIAKRNEISVDMFLKTWIMNQAHELEFLDEKYNRQLDSQSGRLLQQENDISIVNLTNKSSVGVVSGNLGFLGEVVLKLSKSIRDESVFPLLKALNNPNLQQPEDGGTAINAEAIAIVGMSCRYPSSNNLEEFWQILLEGKDATGNPPEFRWLREQCSRTQPNCRKTNAGFLKCPVDDFDAKFFGISPKEMMCLDPQHRLLHELVWEGLEDAAIDPCSLEGTNGGVFTGSWLHDYRDIIRAAGLDEFYRIYMGNSIGGGAARISHFLGLIGPSIATESGCSSAMVAVHLACKSLQNRETNMALACGVNLLLHQFDKDELPMVISPEGRCKTFDAKADGFGRGEGCGVLVLKRLSDAVKNGDKIWALIRGTGMTQEGVSKSMGTPTVHCESLAMKHALEAAKVDPASVSYVETHGTGTVVGDPMEVAAIAKAYHSKERKEPLLIGSVKTNVGHTESCSGITGIMKVVLAMQHEIIPAHRNFESLNLSIDLEAVPAKIPLEPVTWAKQKGIPRLAGVSSFGITGTDAHAILQEAPTTLSPRALSTKSFPRPLHPLKISAKTKEALDILVERYKELLSRSKDKFADIAYTANVGRANFSHRAVLIAKSNEDGMKLIEQNKFMIGEETPESIGKICFLFTGQGSQYPGMAKQLYETSPVFQMHFEYCEKILKNTYNIDVTQVLWSQANSSEVSRTIYSQTSIFCVEYALLKLWESWGVKADYALGHSLGEFAAAVCAGILSVEDALMLVAERSRLIDELPRGKMLVIKAEKIQVEKLMNNFAGNNSSKLLDYAAVNSLEQTVVAGDSDVILQFCESCKKAGLKCIVLEATHAFHSKYMDPMLDDYRKVAKSLKKLEGNSCQYISGMRGGVVAPDQINAEYWVEHTREKVNFLEASQKAVGLGCNVFIELGPQPVLSALTMMNNDTPVICVPSLKKNEKEWETLLNSLGKLYLKGVEIDWNGFDQFHERMKVPLPHYPFIGKKFWPDLLALSGSSIHPLIGSLLPNATSSKLFESALNLRSLEYVRDHAIGDNVIFPGAGYLEMCLASGLATVEGATDSLAAPSRPMKVENLSILAPLPLQEGKTCQLQTIAELNTCPENEMDWNDLTLKIFRRVDDSSASTKWLPHATAIFSPLLSTQEKSVSFDAKQFNATLSKPSNNSILSEIYDKLASVGLKFGPAFRSIEKLWRGEDKDKTLLVKIKLPSDDPLQQQQYIVHPVVLDAMIQAVMMLKLTDGIKKKLYVPIKIGKFVWLAQPSEECSGELYIHAISSSSRSDGILEDSAILIDSLGKPLAIMSSVEFIDTTVKALEAVLEQQMSCLPDLWECKWKLTDSPIEQPIDLKLASVPFNDEAFESFIEETFNKPPVEHTQTFQELELLVYFNSLRALYECGWEPQLHLIVSEDELLTELKIQSEFGKYLGFMMEVLEAEGILERRGQKEGGCIITWEVVKMPPSLEETMTLLNSSLYGDDLSSKFYPTILLNNFGQALCGILKGKIGALSILFPDESKGSPSVADFYSEYAVKFRLGEWAKTIVDKRYNHVVSQMKGKPHLIRILEVGAGTGSYTADFLKGLDEAGVNYEYTYTDISAVFFSGAQKRFEKHLSRMIFKKLNIEEDPIQQGFRPEYYDCIYMAEMIHATRDIKESLRNLRMVMRPYAKLDMLEGTRVNRLISYLFGALEGFWRFQDFDLRQRHCILSKKTWVDVYQSSGFHVEGVFSILNDYHLFVSCYKLPDPFPLQANHQRMSQQVENSKLWILFHCEGSPVSCFLQKALATVPGRRVLAITDGNSFQELKNNEGYKLRGSSPEDFVALFNSILSKNLSLEGIIYCWSLDPKRTCQDEILQPFFHLVQKKIATATKSETRIVAFCTGGASLEDKDLSHFHSSTIFGFVTSLRNEHVEINCRCVDIPFDQEALDEEALRGIYLEVWNSDREVRVALQGKSRYVTRFHCHKPNNTPLKFPNGTDRFQLMLPDSRSISDLALGPLDSYDLAEDEVEVQVNASALNFRDVLSVLKPSEEFKNINMVGFDFSGVVKRLGEKVTKWTVGDRVNGCNMRNQTFPSHVKIHEDLLLNIPDNITMSEAATIPAVYVTSVVCLLETAKIKKEDVVLLHTATGGVGLSAIQICKYVGCTIIATAGSKRKQNYLRRLGIQHIFHSRNTQFGDEILKVTNGRGVNVVLNSLTSEGFKEATMKACAKGARFVEMSMLNIWTAEEVKKLRPDVEYTIIDVSVADRRMLV